MYSALCCGWNPVCYLQLLPGYSALLPSAVVAYSAVLSAVAEALLLSSYVQHTMNGSRSSPVAVHLLHAHRALLGVPVLELCAAFSPCTSRAVFICLDRVVAGLCTTFGRLFTLCFCLCTQFLMCFFFVTAHHHWQQRAPARYVSHSSKPSVPRTSTLPAGPQPPTQSHPPTHQPPHPAHPPTLPASTLQPSLHPPSLTHPTCLPQ